MYPRIVLLISLVLAAQSANATLATYNFNFDTGSGFVTGQFVADAADALANSFETEATPFSLEFNGVNFDMGALRARIGGGYTDITGLAGFSGTPLTSSTTSGVELYLNTCGFIACIARWVNIPGLANGESPAIAQINAVSLADPAPAPAPATLALFGLGLAGLGWSRRKKA